MFKDTDFSLVLGMGCQISNGLNFSVNYNSGLINVLNDASANIAGACIDMEGEEIKHNVIQVGEGWQF